MRTKKISLDIMIGDRYYTTYRGEFPMIKVNGDWMIDLESLEEKILEKYPSLAGKEFRVAF